MRIPDPNAVFPNEYGTSCFIKNVITSPNIQVGEYTYYDDPAAPTGFEKNNVLFHYPEFGDRLIIGKFCALAAGTKFIMGAANHIPSMCLAALGRKTARNTWPSFPLRGTRLWAMTCGLAGNAWLCLGFG